MNFNFSIPETIKKKVCRYLLHRYLGQFLEHNLQLEQLNVDLTSGKGTIVDIVLSTEVLNELCADQGLDVTVTKGEIGFVTINIPYKNPMKEDSYIEVGRLNVSFKSINRPKNESTSMLESMWSSMSSSMQLAQECLEKEGEEPSAPSSGIDGIRQFANLIDNMLSRVKAKFVDTTFRFEQLLDDGKTGIALIMNIERIEYENGASTNLDSKSEEQKDLLDSEEPFASSLYTSHHIKINGVTFYTEEFHIDDAEKQETNMHKSETNVVDCNLTCENQKIPFAKMLEDHQIVFKINDSNEPIGPKVEVEATIGNIVVFCTPRQLWLLIKLADENACEGAQPISGTVNKPYLPEDVNYQKLDSLMYNCWSVPDAYEENLLNSQEFASTSFSMQSSVNSSISNRSRRRRADHELNGDISQFKIHIAFFTFTLLHDDILLKCSLNCKKDDHLSSVSIKTLQKKALEFFDKLEIFSRMKVGAYETKQILKHIQQSVDFHNLTFVATAVLVEQNEQKCHNDSMVNASINIAGATVQEILNDCIVPLVVFTNSANCKTLPSASDIKISYKKVKSRRKIKDRAVVDETITDVVVDLAHLVIEFDISIIDRMGVVLFNRPFYFKSSFENEMEALNTTKTKLTLRGPEINIKTRFPVADLRPVQDPQRSPWWNRSVLPDFLLISAIQPSINIDITASKLSVVANQICIFYCESNDSEKIEIARICSKEVHNCNYQDKEVQCPKITIIIPKEKQLENLKECFTQSDTSDDMSFETKQEKEYSPFSSKRVLRESETCHNRDESSDPESFNVPGDNIEMKHFCESTTNLSKLRIKLNLPVLLVQFRSKQLYEIIYNRICLSLLLWQPSSPSVMHPYIHCPKFNVEEKRKMECNNILHRSTMMESIFAQFPLDNRNNDDCNQSESSSDGENSYSDAIFYSTTDDNYLNNDFKDPTKIKGNLHSTSIEIKIGSGTATLYTPVKDTTDKIIPGQLGEIVLRYTQLYFFMVNGFKGNEDESYICMNVEATEIYHCGIIPTPVPNPPMRMEGVLPKHLKCIIYPMPKDLCQHQIQATPNRSQFSLALQINRCPVESIKHIRISLGFHMTTLRYFVSSISQAWFTQLADMFDVKDYHVNGYKSSSNIIEMHMHLWNCSIDYRPKNHPHRTVATIGNFMISSNVSSTATGCTLRFIAEDATLSLAPQNIENKFSDDSKITVSSNDQLVCVVELGLFEISLRLREKPTITLPKYDLRASINDLHVRTCSDSGRALAQLLFYLASDGDLMTQEEWMNSSETQNYENEINFSNIDTHLDKPVEIPEEQQHAVNNLLIDAMEESPPPVISNSALNQENENVFCFPDENMRIEEDDLDVPTNSFTADLNNCGSLMDDFTDQLPSVKTELGDVQPIVNMNAMTVANINQTYSDFSDFDIIEESMDEAFDIGNGPFLDDHTADEYSSQDPLSAPPDFPSAIQRFTLCDLSFIWHMYDGNDFDYESNNENDYFEDDSSASIVIDHPNMTDNYKLGVSYCKGSPTLSNTSWSKLTWRTRGGVGRKQHVLVDLIVNKVKFIHETYPANTEQASRQVLILTDLILQDRVRASSINTLLYPMQSKDKKLPLLTIKAYNFRTNSQPSTKECCLRIQPSGDPIRLHIDQITLEFLIKFFGDLSKVPDDEKTNSTAEIQALATVHHPPIMTVELPEAAQQLQARKMVSENLRLLMDSDDVESNIDIDASDQTSDDNSPMYFRSVVFSPEIQICVDYQGKRVDISKGPIAGLLMGLGQLQCSQITLKRLSCKGVLGGNKLAKILIQEWLNDIKKRQLPRILGGVGPIHSLVQVFQGLFDLIRLPIEQYRKDGCIVKGFKLGCQSFTACTALAMLEIAVRVINALQVTAEICYDMLSPGHPIRKRKRNNGRRKMIQAPQDIREGVANACQIVKDGIIETTQELREMANIERDMKGPAGVFGVVIRGAVPAATVRPIVIATKATSNILEGVKNQLIPEARSEAKAKYKNNLE